MKDPQIMIIYEFNDLPAILAYDLLKKELKEKMDVGYLICPPYPEIDPTIDWDEIGRQGKHPTKILFLSIHQYLYDVRIASKIIKTFKSTFPDSEKIFIISETFSQHANNLSAIFGKDVTKFLKDKETAEKNPKYLRTPTNCSYLFLKEENIADTLTEFISKMQTELDTK